MENPTVILITSDALDLDQVVKQISRPSTGASVVFTGLVRKVTTRVNPHETTHLVYDVYRPMAEAKMAQLANEIRQRWPAVQGIAIIQRIGKLKSGALTTVVACTSPHRDDGIFEAARFGIDRLKEIVPIWKKEIGPDGEIWVEGSYHPKSGE